MLQIAPTQLDSLALPFEAGFVARVRRFVEEKAPQLVQAAGPSFDTQLDAALHDARTLGVVSEQEQVLHVILSLVHGVGYAGREPWAIDVVEARRAAGFIGGLPQALMEAGHGVPARGG